MNNSDGSPAVATDKNEIIAGNKLTNSVYRHSFLIFTILFDT